MRSENSIGCSLPRHPADQIRFVVTAGHAVHFALRRWVELWAYGKPMPDLTDAHVAQVQLDCNDWNCGGSCQSDPGTDIFDGRATGYSVHLGSLDRDPDQQRTERQYDRWIADDACQVCYLTDATCSAFGKRTCERCQDELHRGACKYPLHPAEQRELLYEELDHAIENLGETRAEFGSGAVSMGYDPSQALYGFDASPWEGFIAQAEDQIKAITAWIGPEDDSLNVESPNGVVYDDQIPF